MKTLRTLAIAALGLAVTSLPALAGDFQVLPEPSSLGLIAAGVAAAVIAGRYRRRK